MSTYQDFYTAVLQNLGLPVTAGNLDALCGVAIYEGLNDRFNPMNSVVQCGNSVPFNSVGVQDYKSYTNGVNGTVKLLEGSPWLKVRQALFTGIYQNVVNALTETYTWAIYTPPSEAQAHSLWTQSIGDNVTQPIGIDGPNGYNIFNANFEPTLPTVDGSTFQQALALGLKPILDAIAELKAAQNPVQNTNGTYTLTLDSTANAGG